ncbi:MAG TPA: MarR family transcriptional regulator [Gaiellaceae bacterium]|nr:MarR family transcriptional regulator [Gaiellaceae bacterium]
MMLTVNEVEVAGRLRPVLLKLARELRREVADLGVSGGQATLLATIKAQPGVSAAALAAQERMSAAGMSGHIDRLAALGLVRRDVDPADRRRQALRLTAEGEALLRKVRSRRTAWLASRLGELPPHELAAVEAALDPLAKLLEVGE